jgi:hypothetical protein
MESKIMADDEVEITITISKKAYEKAARLAKDEKGPAREWAEFLTTEEYIEQMVIIALED